MEISFPEADPLDPSNYEELFTRWKAAIESNPVFASRNVNIREILTIGEPDDYEDWRRNRGAYNVSTWPQDSFGSITAERSSDD